MNGTQTDVPVSTILGDRLCVKCAYNLRGQAVVKESHYGLFIARCPECNTPAALQEYPLLGRWPGRIRVFVALAYALACAGSLGFTCLILGMMAGGLSSGATGTLAMDVSRLWAEHVNAEEAEGRTPLAGSPSFVQNNRDADGKLVATEWMYIDRAWWDRERSRVLVGSFASHTWAAMRSQWMVLLPIGLGFFVMGACWSVLLLAARPRALIVASLVPAGIVVIFAFAINSSGAGLGKWEYSNHLVEDRTFLASLVGVIGMWLVFGGLGLVYGRSLARVAVRALLPATFRGALAELWFTDGKPLPMGTRAPRTLYPEVCPPCRDPRSSSSEPGSRD